MDIKTLDALVAADEEGATITIYQKGGDPYLAADGTESTMTVLGSESKQYRAAKRQITDRMMKRRRATMSAEDVERNAIFLAASAVVGWHGWESGKDKLECTPDNLRLVLAIEHIRDQVEEAIRGHSDFFIPPSKG